MTFAVVTTDSNSATSGTPGTTASSNTITAPSSGDLVVFHINSNHAGTPSAPTIDSDSGASWTTARTDDVAGDSVYAATAWKIANGSEPTSYSWTVNNSYWRVCLYVFSSATDAEVDASCAFARHGNKQPYLRCDAYASQVISDNAVAIVFGGKDNRSTGGVGQAYTDADNSYGNVDGDVAYQILGSACRIYTTGETVAANAWIRIDVADDDDNKSDFTHSHHLSFVESAAASAFPYHSVKQQRKDMKTLLTM